MDESSDVAISIIASLNITQPPHDSPVVVPAMKLYRLAEKYIEMYNIINKGRSTFVDNSRYTH